MSRRGTVLPFGDTMKTAKPPRIVSATAAKELANITAGSREAQLRAALEKSDPLAGVTSANDVTRLTALLDKMAEGLSTYIEGVARRQGKDFVPDVWRWHSAPSEGGRGANASDEEIARMLKHLVLQYEVAGYHNVGAEIRHAYFTAEHVLERSHVELGPNFSPVDEKQLIRALG